MKQRRAAGRTGKFVTLGGLALPALGVMAALGALGVVLVPVVSALAEPAPRSFTYQGTLLDGGVPANGFYDIQARLFDASGGGSQVGATFSASGVSVADGLLTTPMTFGPLASFNGTRLWVQIDLRPAGGGAFTPLSPRQELTAAPYALGLVTPCSVNSAERYPINVFSSYAGTDGAAIIATGPVGLQANSSATPAQSLSGIGLIGNGGDNGVWGVYGVVNVSSGLARGVYGSSNGLGGTGVYGVANFGTTSQGVFGFSQQGLGVVAAGRTAVKGDATGGGSDFGGQFISTGINSNGLKGECNNGTSAYGVWGTSTTGEAGHFSGKVAVIGALSKSSGSFKIDHPLDPSGKYLYHSFVESPDMMNIYNGLVTTDARGYASVSLPDWFTALNRDYRYQLTIIDEGDSPDFVLAKIVRGVPVDAPRGAPAAFTLRTSRPGVKVSWQVTGIRQDAWANAHRIQVEEPKVGLEAGRYLHPELFGQPASLSMEAGKLEAAATTAATTAAVPVKP